MKINTIIAAARVISALSAIGAGLLAPHVHAEGAVRILDCKATQRCDAGGRCDARSEDIVFRLEPQALADDGSGQYTLRYGDTVVPMQALGEAGPFVWTVQDVRYTLLVSSQTQLLLHALAPAAVPSATVDFLNCSVKQ